MGCNLYAICVRSGGPFTEYKVYPVKVTDEDDFVSYEMKNDQCENHFMDDEFLKEHFVLIERYREEWA